MVPLFFSVRTVGLIDTSLFFCYSDGGRSGGGDFVAGFLLGGAVFGTLAYVFAPQVKSMFCCFVLISYISSLANKILTLNIWISYHHCCSDSARVYFKYSHKHASV